MFIFKPEMLHFSNVGNDNKIYIGRNVNINNFFLKILGDMNFFLIEDDVKIEEIKITINGNGNTIIISNKVQGNMIEIKILKSDSCFIFLDENIRSLRTEISIVPGGINAIPTNSSFYVGKNTIFNGTIVFKIGEKNNNILIGNHCLFASNIRVTTTDNHAIYSISDYKRTNFSGDVIIGDHCWVCNNVNILNNTEIGKNSVISLGSIVTKKFKQSNILIGGIPAQVLRRGINWDINLDDEKIDFTDSEIITNNLIKSNLSLDYLKQSMLEKRNMCYKHGFFLSKEWFC